MHILCLQICYLYKSSFSNDLHYNVSHFTRLSRLFLIDFPSVSCTLSFTNLTWVFSNFKLTIRVTDVNDNAPKFELPDYQAHNVDEDYPLGTSILKVKAVDADSGANAEIEYHVSDDHFVVDASGIVSNNKQLDADNNNAYYEFVITAKDKGLYNLFMKTLVTE